MSVQIPIFRTHCHGNIAERLCDVFILLMSEAESVCGHVEQALDHAPRRSHHAF